MVLLFLVVLSDERLETIFVTFQYIYSEEKFTRGILMCRMKRHFRRYLEHGTCLDHLFW